jgi:thiamine biosynthesis lipoprotein
MLLLVLCGCASTRQSGNSFQRFEFQQVQMGLPFRLVVWTQDPVLATNSATRAFRRIAEINDLMSDYEDASELSRLSRSSGDGGWHPVSDELWKVLRRAHEISEATQGGFDVTVGPLVQVWRRARRQRELPVPARIEAAKEVVGWNKIEFDTHSQSVRLRAAGMRLDLGGIAKGYALDEVAAVLRHQGIRRFLISGSGDMVVGDPPPGQPGWRIEVAPLDITNAPPARYVQLKNAALCTSGDVFQHVEIGGKRYSHIVDPRTGVGLTDHSLVTVIGRDGMTSDALSTSVSVVGPERGLQLAKRFRADVLVVRIPDQRVEEYSTAGFGRWLGK